jgi:multidrug efflux pump subunit AcrA (membrane-fusion protein)
MSMVDPAPFLDPSPPPWAARSLAWVLLAIFVVAAIGLVLVQVPESVSARFVLVPVRGTDPVRTLHNGVVSAVRVNDADTVEAGAILFTIESEDVGDRTSERDSLGTSLSGGALRLANERDKYENQRRADEQEAGRLQQRLQALESQATLTNRQAELAREVATRQQRSYDEGLISWLEASRPRLEADRLTAEAEQVRAEAAETRAASARLRFEMASRRAAFDEVSRAVEEELARARTRKGMLDGEQSRDGNALLVSAPCGGTVVKLLVRSPGTAVNALDVLAEIVCRDERLQAELIVPQRGLARLNTGQAVKFRYDAYPYQRYGVRYGTLRWISPATAPQPDGASFRALADLDEQVLRVGGQDRPVLPGMGGEASVIVGRRSLASYAFEPLRQMREALATERPVARRN